MNLVDKDKNIDVHVCGGGGVDVMIFLVMLLYNHNYIVRCEVKTHPVYETC